MLLEELQKKCGKGVKANDAKEIIDDVPKDCELVFFDEENDDIVFYGNDEIIKTRPFF